jgi:Ca-activated chloride channel family protein
MGASTDGAVNLAVEVADAAGEPVSNASAVPLQVYVGEELVASTSTAHEVDWQVTILFDRLLSESRLIQSAALDLSEIADQLVELGEVEVVLGGGDFTRAVLPTRDAEELRQALTWLRIREGGDAAQLEVRRQFERDFDMQKLAEQPYASVSATAGQTVSELRFGVRHSLQEEGRIIERQRRALLDWLLENRKSTPSLLILVSSGDDEPAGYYNSLLAAAGLTEAMEGAEVDPVEPTSSEMGRALSSLGWIALAYAPGASSVIRQGQAPGTRPGDDQVETVVQDGEVVDRTLLGSFDPRDLFRRSGDEDAEQVVPRLVAPLATMAEMADATGGELVTDRQGLSRTIARLEGRAHLRLGVPTRSFIAQSVRIQYEDDAGEGLAAPRARRWISAGTPELLAEIRAHRLLAEGVEDGPLLVSAQLMRRSGVDLVAVEIDSPDDAPLEIGSGPLRLTVGVLDEQDKGRFQHSTQVVESENGVLALEAELGLLPGSNGPVVVLVEDLMSGKWGGTYATLIGSVADDSSNLLLPLPRVIHLLEPADQMVIGQTMFEVVHDPEVERVEFYLDGELATSRTSRPFAASLDLGRLPEPHRIEVVAFDAAGRELGRDRLALNESGGIFRVRIVRPRARETAGRERPLTGPVPVEAHIEIPRSGAIERVEYYWNDSLVATRYAPPYVQRVPVPAEEPQGFFRVVAYLADGSSAEDVVFVNSPGGSERVKVELIQLYAVVTDREGRPYQGLESNSFRVLEEGVEQEIAAFNEAKDQPLTVGLAIDASASMFVKLPRVQKAAGSFLRGLDTTKDRAFVVDFGTEPKLHHDTSRDLGAVEAALSSLVPEGQTAIWKGIAFSLVQLQGVPGKKALIVFSDGADEDRDFSFRTSLKFAQRVGVPIYVIVSNDEIYRTGGRGLNVRGFINRLESLTRTVGGRVYFSRVGEDLEEIYAQIDDELRSQYLVGYYARDTDEDRWRSVRIEVDAPGARARTVAGYFR